MYADHVPLLAEHARTPSGFADIVSFAIATQNQRFYLVERIMCGLRAGEEMRQLTRAQQLGIAFVRQHARRFMPSRCVDTNKALRVLLELPQISYVKAGFILQMCGYEIACLDVHNCRAAGINAKALSRIPACAELLHARVEMYIMVCHVLGGAEYLWDSWCGLIATKYPRQFRSADEVSAYHVQCVKGL